MITDILFTVEHKNTGKIFNVLDYCDQTQCFLCLDPETGEFIRDYFSAFKSFSCKRNKIF